MRRLARGFLDAVILGVIVHHAAAIWWERRVAAKYGCDCG